MSVDITDAGMGSPSESMNVGCLETLLKAAQQQQARQVKRFLQLKKQAEHALETQAAWQQKEAQEEERRLKREEEQAAAGIERAAHRAEVAVRRVEAQQAAERALEANRERVLLKIEEAERRASAMVAEKEQEAAMKRVRDAAKAAARQEAYERSLAGMEARRDVLQDKLDSVEERLRERDEVKVIQEKIRKEEQFLRDLRRRETAMRAAAEEEAARQVAQAKSALKDELLQRRLQEEEVERRHKAQEWQEHWGTIRARVEAAATESEARRDHLSHRLEEKMQRGDQLAQQKERLVGEMAALRRQMAAQEAAMKDLMDRAMRGDTRALHSADLAHLAPGLTMSTGRPRSAGASPTATQHMQSADTSRLHSHSRPQSARLSSPTAHPHAPTLSLQTTTRSPLRAPAHPAKVPAAHHGSAPYRRLPLSQQPPYAPPSTPSTSAAAAHRAAGSPRATASAPSTTPAALMSLGPQERKLLQILEEELAKEAQREATLAQVADEKELQRLTKLYALQRELARQKILALQGTSSVLAASSGAGPQQRQASLVPAC